MAMKNSKKILLAVGVVCYCVFTGIAEEHGEVWCTLKNGNGCSCHVDQAAPGVHVWLEGPTLLALNTPTLYVVHISGGPAVAAGYNVAAGHGTLTPYDTASRVIDNELTHSFPKEFGTDTVVTWTFLFTGTSSGYDTLFTVANSVNRDHSPTGDQWNFGENFILSVGTTAVHRTQEPSRTFSLEQNFPNPFNPKTTIRFHTNVDGRTTVRVYDVLGREIAVLLDKFERQGEHLVVWDAQNIPSGLYFYQLNAGELTDVKKMIVVK